MSMIITTIVAFYVNTWIEMRPSLAYILLYSCHISCGVWIETYEELLLDTTKKVVLQMSMWIENDIPTNFYGNYFNRTSHVWVVWNCRWLEDDKIKKQSHSTWVRGLKPFKSPTKWRSNQSHPYINAWFEMIKKHNKTTW